MVLQNTKQYKDQVSQKQKKIFSKRKYETNKYFLFTGHLGFEVTDWVDAKVEKVIVKI